MVGSTRSYEMARRMVAAGHEVHLITSRRDQNGSASGWCVECIDGIQAVSYTHLTLPTKA